MKKLLTIAALLSFVAGSQMYGIQTTQQYSPRKFFDVKKWFKRNTQQRAEDIENSRVAGYGWAGRRYGSGTEMYQKTIKRIDKGLEFLNKKYGSDNPADGGSAVNPGGGDDGYDKPTDGSGNDVIVLPK